MPDYGTCGGCGNKATDAPHPNGEGYLCHSCVYSPCDICGGRAARPNPHGENGLCIKHHPPDALARYRSRAKESDRPFELNRDQFLAVYIEPCSWCPEPVAYGVDRFHQDEGYTPENSTPCCSTCNYAKRFMQGPEFAAWIATLALPPFAA